MTPHKNKLTPANTNMPIFKRNSTDNPPWKVPSSPLPLLLLTKCLPSKGGSSSILLSLCLGANLGGGTNGHFIHSGPTKGPGVLLLRIEKECSIFKTIVQGEEVEIFSFHIFFLFFVYSICYGIITQTVNKKVFITYCGQWNKKFESLKITRNYVENNVFFLLAWNVWKCSFLQ